MKITHKLYNPSQIQPIEFYGSPIDYKYDGVYGYLIPSGNKVLFFFPTFESVDHKEMIDWVAVDCEKERMKCLLTKSFDLCDKLRFPTESELNELRDELREIYMDIKSES